MPREKKQIYGIYVNGALTQPDCIVTIGEKKWDGKLLSKSLNGELVYVRLDRMRNKDVCVSKYQIRMIPVTQKKEDLTLT